MDAISNPTWLDRNIPDFTSGRGIGGAETFSRLGRRPHVRGLRTPPKWPKGYFADFWPKTGHPHANRGTKRGREAVAASLKQFGAGRSILLDGDGNILAGNKTVEQAASAEFENVIVVQTTGELVAVQRMDLSINDPKARGLAIADNRTSEIVLDWDADVLGELIPDLDTQPFFSTDEIAEFLGLTGDAGDEPPTTDQSGSLKDAYSVLVECGSESAQLDLLERLTSEGFSCRSLIA
jgi:hypothetical protein